MHYYLHASTKLFRYDSKNKRWEILSPSGFVPRKRLTEEIFSGMHAITEEGARKIIFAPFNDTTGTRCISNESTD